MTAPAPIPALTLSAEVLAEETRRRFVYLQSDATVTTGALAGYAWALRQTLCALVDATEPMFDSRSPGEFMHYPRAVFDRARALLGEDGA